MSNYSEFRQSILFMPVPFSVEDAVRVGISKGVNRDGVLQILSDLCSSGLMVCRDGVVEHISYTFKIDNKSDMPALDAAMKA